MNTTKPKMQFHFNSEQNYLSLKTFDTIDKETLVELITTSATKARKQNYNRILFDHRGCYLDISYIELHQITSNLDRLGLTSDFQCVVIYDVDAEKYRFSDTVIHNWCGWIVRFYNDYQHGLNWLLR